MRRIKKIEEQITPERSRVKTHRDSNMFFEHYISSSKITIFDEESILKILEITPENRLVLQLLDTIRNLAPICVLRSLGSQ